MVSCKRSQVPAAVVVEQREDRTRSRPAPSQHTRRPIRHWSRRAVGCRATAAPVRPVCATSSDSGLRPAWLNCLLVCRSWVRFFRSRSVPRGTDIIVLASRRATHREKSLYVYVLGTAGPTWSGWRTPRTRLPAEAVICISNNKISPQVLHGLERFGIRAFAPISVTASSHCSRTTGHI